MLKNHDIDKYMHSPTIQFNFGNKKRLLFYCNHAELRRHYFIEGDYTHFL